MSKLKVGDIVKVKSIIKDEPEYYPFSFTLPMLERFGGKYVHITRIKPKSSVSKSYISLRFNRFKEDPFAYFIKEDDTMFTWHSSMFEDQTINIF